MRFWQASLLVALVVAMLSVSACDLMGNSSKQQEMQAYKEYIDRLNEYQKQVNEYEQQKEQAYADYLKQLQGWYEQQQQVIEQAAQQAQQQQKK